MNNNLWKLISSVAKTAVLSLAVSGIVSIYAGHFWVWFTLSFIVQFIVFYILNTFLEYRSVKDAHMLLLKQAELVALNTIKVQCANCKKESEIVVRLDQENRYTCGYCKVKNSVFILTETAAVTEPLYETNPIPNTSSTNGL